MWYKTAWRRHLCDMHVDDWSTEFLSQFEPEVYLNNLRRARIQSTMVPFQSHVGLCYYPTKIGKMHNALRGREDVMKKLTEMCREEGISVTGYYSLIFNNYEHDRHPEWRMAEKSGKSYRTMGMDRYGVCCPNNMEYRSFVSEQIREISEYFTFDGMFFDMTTWPYICYCDSCRKRWADEVGGDISEVENWNDTDWIRFVRKREEWLGEFAMWVTSEMKSVAPHVSVEHNFADGVKPQSGTRLTSELVNTASDYAGGDLYGNLYSRSFACKFYKNISQNAPFEYISSRCEPGLAKHTTLKSLDIMRSETFLVAAHHGASLIMDAIDPAGTMDESVYYQIGKVFEEQIPYEVYFTGEMIEDVGIYYSLKSKYCRRNEPYCNHEGSVRIMENLVCNHISCGVTGSFHDIDKYKVLIASCLSDEDECDNQRLIRYVENGGNLYFSGAGNAGLLKTFFGAECSGRTEEKVTYIAPNEKLETAFGRLNKKCPMHFDGTAPIVEGINKNNVIATLTLPYKGTGITCFASIHSNPPGVNTDIPAMAVIKYGRGTVLWSAVPIECLTIKESSYIFLKLLKEVFSFKQTFTTNAPRDVEITCFQREHSIQVNVVLLNEDYEARQVETFWISLKCKKHPDGVRRISDNENVNFTYKDDIVTFQVSDVAIFAMYEIVC